MFIMTELNNIIATSEYINLYNDGEVSIYRPQEISFNKIVDGWKIMCKNAHEMPAFGVSLNDETIKARGVGLWIEFVFDKQYSHSEMTFKKLLIKVEKSWQGFNIVRYNAQNGYSGRCYFIDLSGKDMSNFYDILADL